MSTIEAVPRDLPGCKSSGAAITPIEEVAATNSTSSRSDEHKRAHARAHVSGARHGTSARKSASRNASAPSRHTRTSANRDSARSTVAQSVDDILAVHALDVRDTEPQAAPSFPDTLPSQRFVWLTKLRGWIHARRKQIDPTAPATMARTFSAPQLELPERPLDLVLLGTALALLTIGTIEIHSATSAEALSKFHSSTHFLTRQLLYVGVGGIAMYIATRIDYGKLRKFVYPMLLLALVLLAAVLAFPAKNGAKRWIPLGPLTFQPVELAKLALISYLAYSLARKADKVKAFTVGFVPHLVVCGMMMVLLLKQPDLGSSIVLGATTLGMLFVAGTRISYIMFAILGATPIAYYLVVGTPWRMQRFLAYFNPEAFAQKEAYQFLQARLALGSGGLTGHGLGGGHQTLGYMPEAHNDFILAPIGEEMGFIGVALVIGLFVLLVWRGIRAALSARDPFGGYLAFGITLLFAVQALFNIGVVLGVVPNKGITLPLVSYGGTSLIAAMFAVGLLLNIGRRPERRDIRAKQLVNRTVFATPKKQRVRVVVG